MLVLAMFSQKKRKKTLHASAPADILSQRSCHYVEEAELLSKSGRTRKKQGKGGGENILFGFIAKQKFD